MQSHKEGVLDIFQEHVAFCHDVVLLSKSRQGIKVPGKDSAQPALRAHCCFQNRWKLGVHEGHFQPQKENHSLLADLINLYFDLMAQANPCLTCELPA